MVEGVSWVNVSKGKCKVKLEFLQVSGEKQKLELAVHSALLNPDWSLSDNKDDVNIFIIYRIYPIGLLDGWTGT